MTTTTTTKITFKNVLSSPRMYVDYYMTNSKDVKINYQGDLYHVNNDGLNSENIKNSIWLDYKEDVASYNAGKPKEDKVTRFPQVELGYALDEYVAKHRFEELKLLRNRFKCTREDLTELEKFVKSITGKTNELDLAVFAHFLWQIKRKLNGYNTVYEMMPVIYGKQGSGKSYAVELLTRPLNDVRMNLSLDVLTDNRRFPAFCNNFICVADELEGANRTDIDALKRMITAKELEYPILYSNSTGRVRQNCTIIGTTNRHLNTQIVDKTGMRRFYQMDSLDKVDSKLLNSIDFKKLWRGIDENIADGYVVGDIATKLNYVQKTYTAVDPFDDFCEENGITNENDNKVLVPLETVFNAYKSFCIDNNVKANTKQSFATKINNLGIDKKRQDYNGKRNQTHYYLPACSYFGDNKNELYELKRKLGV